MVSLSEARPLFFESVSLRSLGNLFIRRARENFPFPLFAGSRYVALAAVLLLSLSSRRRLLAAKVAVCFFR